MILGFRRCHLSGEASCSPLPDCQLSTKCLLSRLAGFVQKSTTASARYRALRQQFSCCWPSESRSPAMFVSPLPLGVVPPTVSSTLTDCGLADDVPSVGHFGAIRSNCVTCFTTSTLVSRSGELLAADTLSCWKLLRCKCCVCPLRCVEWLIRS